MSRWLAVALVGCGLAMAGVAYATIPDSSGTIHGCYNKGGAVRVIDPSAGGVCAANETALDWSQTGPAGEEGPTGPPGPPGPPGASAPAADAVDATIEITGQVQGVFNDTPLPIDGLSHEIVSPHDPATGLPTGKRQHKPFTITKEIDKTTPLLLNALVNNEHLTRVMIAIQGESRDTVMTIELENAFVAARSQQGPEEHVSFVYEHIKWTWVETGTTSQDSWAQTPP